MPFTSLQVGFAQLGSNIIYMPCIGKHASGMKAIKIRIEYFLNNWKNNGHIKSKGVQF